MATPPWLAPDGSTDVDGFIAAYEHDSNVFWRMECGHHQNVIDALIERAEVAEAQLTTALETIRMLAE